MEYQSRFSGKTKKNIIDLLFAEWYIVKVNMLYLYSER